jgi:uncharacterized protein YjbI with pentapeptide repeats
LPFVFYSGREIFTFIIVLSWTLHLFALIFVEKNIMKKWVILPLILLIISIIICLLIYFGKFEIRRGLNISLYKNSSAKNNLDTIKNLQWDSLMFASINGLESTSEKLPHNLIGVRLGWSTIKDINEVGSVNQKNKNNKKYLKNEEINSFKEIRFEKSSLFKVKFENLTMSNINFRDSILEDVTFKNVCFLRDVDFSNALLIKVKIEYSSDGWQKCINLFKESESLDEDIRKTTYPEISRKTEDKKCEVIVLNGAKLIDLKVKIENNMESVQAFLKRGNTLNGCPYNESSYKKEIYKFFGNTSHVYKENVEKVYEKDTIHVYYKISEDAKKNLIDINGKYNHEYLNRIITDVNFIKKSGNCIKFFGFHEIKKETIKKDCSPSESDNCWIKEKDQCKFILFL